MNSSNKEKIYKLMCSDCWQVGVELFKANNLNLYEFIDYAIHRSNYTESIIERECNIIIYNRFTNILNTPFKVRVHYYEGRTIYINAFFNKWNVYHSGLNIMKKEKEKQQYLISEIYNKIKPIIYDN